MDGSLKIKILSSFTHTHHVIPIPHVVLSFVIVKIIIFSEHPGHSILYNESKWRLGLTDKIYKSCH